MLLLPESANSVAVIGTPPWLGNCTSMKELKFPDFDTVVRGIENDAPAAIRPAAPFAWPAVRAAILRRARSRSWSVVISGGCNAGGEKNIGAPFVVSSRQ